MQRSLGHVLRLALISGLVPQETVSVGRITRLSCILVITTAALFALPQTEKVRVVKPENLLAAMRDARAAGYDPRATTNGIRFQTDVLLRLAKAAIEHDPANQSSPLPLLIEPEIWYSAFVDVNCPDGEVPEYVTRACENNQHIVIDYRRDRVVEEVYDSSRVGTALNVGLCWPETAGAKPEFSYDDKYSTPNLRVINERVITYRLLELDDMVACEEIRGLRGRVTTGPLRFLFSFGKPAAMRQYRIAISDAGLQGVTTVGKKFFVPFRTFVTITKDGITAKVSKQEIPQFMRRLSRPLDVEFVPLNPNHGLCTFEKEGDRVE